MSKKVLVLGGTGAMGQHLVPILASLGYTVDVVYDRFEEMKREAPNVRYIKADGKDWQFIDDILKNGYDGIVDFLIYPS
ncbi:MAG: NAD(P)-dependent oxidoreductase, partial [Victivallales bacterium]|nr:NAD(P)-dependent oxidoreductase [Victivallales bacterium]